MPSPAASPDADYGANPGEEEERGRTGGEPPADSAAPGVKSEVSAKLEAEGGSQQQNRQNRQNRPNRPINRR